MVYEPMRSLVGMGRYSWGWPRGAIPDVPYCLPREKTGLTWRALAERVGISEQFMGEIESGWRSATPVNLLKIAAALNCPPAACCSFTCPVSLLHENWFWITFRAGATERDRNRDHERS
jgi:transcriptional regulator with XRE-family HTH domain